MAQEQLGPTGDAAAAYAKDVVMADFELPGDSDMIEKVKADLVKAGKSSATMRLEKELAALEAEARKQVMAE